MPNPLTAAIREAERDQPDYTLLRRLFYEIMQRATRGLWVLPAAVLTEVRENVLAQNIYVQMARTFTYGVSGDEYELSNGFVYSLLPGEWPHFLTHVPADAYTVVSRSVFDGVNGVVRTFGREAIRTTLVVTGDATAPVVLPAPPPMDPPPPSNLPQPLPAPSNLAAGTPAQTNMPLTWVDNAGDETSYEVEWKLSTSGTWTPITGLAANLQAHTVPGLSAGLSYDFRIRCVRGTDVSPYSNIATRSTAPSTAVPNAPSGLVAITPATTSMVLTWQDNATDESSYEVEYRLAGGASSIAVANLTSGQDGADASTYVTASVTLNANRLALLAIHIFEDAATPPTVSSVTGLTATWVSVTSILYDDAGTRRGRLVVFRTMVGTNQTGAVTITLSGAAKGAIWSLDELNGVDTSGTNGSGAIAQSATGSGSSTSPSVTLATFIDAANNVAYGVFAQTAIETQTVEGGYTQLASQAASTGQTCSLLAEQHLGQDLSVSATYGALVNWGGVAIEVKRGVGAAWTAITGLPANTITHTVPTLTPNTGYEFRVLARNATGPSGYSNLANGTTLAPDPPLAPTNLAHGAPATTSIPLTWLDNAVDETAYEVQFKQSSVSTWSVDSASLPAGSTARTVSGLTSGISYDFRVRCLRNTVASAFSNIVTVTTAAPPPPIAPSGLVAGAPGQTTMPLTWLDNATDETFYEVEFKRTVDSSWIVFIDTLAPNTLTHTVTGLTPGVLYDFRVRCRNGSGPSGYSNIVTQSTLAASPLATPTSLAAGVPTQTAVPLTWVDNAVDEDAYHVEYRVQGASVWTVFTTTLPANTQAQTVTGLTAGTPYEFRVRCARGSTNSGYSNTATTTTAAPPPPLAPSSLVTGNPSQSTMPLSWIDNATDETLYHVEYRVVGAGSWTVATNTLPANSQTYTVTGLAAGTAYEFRVRCERSGTMSGYSNVATRTTLTTAAGGWSNPATWPGGVIPTNLTDVIIGAGQTILLDTMAAVCRSLTIEAGGILKASRAVSSTLRLHGNLIVRGELDIGKTADRIPLGVTVILEWVLNQANYVGGGTGVPIASDVGLWAVQAGQVFVHGYARETWSDLAATAASGQPNISVDPNFAASWQVGDTLVLSQTARPTASSAWQDESRTIASIGGGGAYTLNSNLSFTHDRFTVVWTDRWGDVWTEVQAGKVVNLTNNVVFRAVDPNHRPHIIFLDSAKHFVENLTVIDFSPGGTAGNTAGRYAWHNHKQTTGSSGSYLKRAVIRATDVMGDGIHTHESFDILFEDLALYRTATFPFDAPNIIGGFAITLESDFPGVGEPLPEHASDGCIYERVFCLRSGPTPPAAFRFSHWWMEAAVGCQLLGCVAAQAEHEVSSQGSAFQWPEGVSRFDNEVPWTFRIEAFCNRSMGLMAHQNGVPFQTLNDIRTWRNGGTGGRWGAYVTNYHLYNVRSIGNGGIGGDFGNQWMHSVIDFQMTGFLFDCQNIATVTAEEIQPYVFNSLAADSTYEDGVVLNVAAGMEDFRHQGATRPEPMSSDPGLISHVQLARVTFDNGLIRMGGESGGGRFPPFGSYIRVRDQIGITGYPANFTLWHRDEPSITTDFVDDPTFFAKRRNNDTTGTRPATSRCFMSAPTDDVLNAGIVTLTVLSNAGAGVMVRFFEGKTEFASVALAAGSATTTFDMATLTTPAARRRAYFWAEVTNAAGADTVSRVVRVRKS